MDLPKKTGRENMSHIEDPMEVEDTLSNQGGYMSHASGLANEYGSKERKSLRLAFIEMRLEDKREGDRDKGKLNKSKGKAEYETVMLPGGSVGYIINGVTYLVSYDENDNKKLVPLNDEFFKFIQEMADSQALKPQPQP